MSFTIKQKYGRGCVTWLAQGTVDPLVRVQKSETFSFGNLKLKLQLFGLTGNLGRGPLFL